MLDLILRNGLMIDGSGAAGRPADIGVLNGRIEYLGRGAAPEAAQVVDVTGLVVAPGFIDGHTHAEGYTLDGSAQFTGKVAQGVTSEILGNCGLSVFPVDAGHVQQLRDYFGPFTGPTYHLSYDWTDYTSLKRKLVGRNLLTNVRSLVGHGSLHIAVMGFERRPPDPGELRRMEELAAQAFEQGAVGLSLGLMYPPGQHAGIEELLALTRVAARYGRPVTSHMRNETFHLVESVQEMIHLAELSGCTMVVSHHKAVGRLNWGKIRGTLRIIDRARSRGLNVYCDVYPYTAGNTVLRALLPPWVLDGGIDRMLLRLKDREQRSVIRQWMLDRDDWENLSLAGGWDAIVIAAARSQHQVEGHTIASLARDAGKDPCDYVFDLLIEEEGDVMMLLFTASEEDLETAMRQPYCMIASDGIPASRPHPRLYGTFPRFLNHYVLQRGLMSLEEGIRRITSLPAAVYGFSDRGSIAPGMSADLIVLAPSNLADRATYDEPALPPSGIRHVLVAGVPVILNGAITGARPGVVI